MHSPEDEVYIEDLSPTHQRCVRLRSRIYSASSAFQRIEVVDTYDYGRALILDGTIQATERDTFIYHEVLVHPPLLMQDQPVEVLVIGGGDGGILVELLKHSSVRRAVVVEVDGMVVDASREYLQGICGEAWDDPRTELHIGDGRKYIEESRERFDTIILDLTDPIGPSTSLYTREAYGHLSERLTDTGVVVTHTGGWFHHPKVSGSIVATLRSVFRHVAVFPVHVPSYGMEIAFAYASPAVDTGSFPSEPFAARYAALSASAELRYVTGDFVRRIAFQPALMQEYLRTCDRVSTDAEPLEFTDYYPWG
ncbi:MAG: polyamine aminopropyltransferase [Gemmatimonadota bacterium]|nr:MAG: polyamine aminopropyltransferase [Gemmatimonadota bacterium]